MNYLLLVLHFLKLIVQPNDSVKIICGYQIKLIHKMYELSRSCLLYWKGSSQFSHMLFFFFNTVRRYAESDGVKFYNSPWKWRASRRISHKLEIFLSFSGHLSLIQHLALRKDWSQTIFLCGLIDNIGVIWVHIIHETRKLWGQIDVLPYVGLLGE